MTAHRGEGRLMTIDGTLIEERVQAWISDEQEGRPSYVRSGPYGEVWVAEGDLMREPLRSDPACILEWLDSTDQVALRLRVNSWTDGGRRAQLVVTHPHALS